MYNLEIQIPCQWNDNYEKLKKYYEEHGHVNLPSRCAKDHELDRLCVWVSKQKAQYKAYCADLEGNRNSNSNSNSPNSNSNTEQQQTYGSNRKRKPTKARPFRIAALEQLGIQWTPRDDKWAINYEKLVKYKEEHGTTQVPTKNYPDKNFAHWIATQRYDYKMFKENKKTCLTPERLGLLREVGFVFNVFDQKWDEMFGSLLEFKRENGHINVVEGGGSTGGSTNGRSCHSTLAKLVESQKKESSLAKWVERQRMEYQLFINGQGNSRKCRMTKERIKRLQDIGFAFVLDAESTSNDGTDTVSL